MAFLRISLRVGVASAFVATLLYPASSSAAETPNSGAYVDAGIATTGSRLEFTVNPAGTRIERGAVLKTGFPCAPKTVVTSKGAPIIDGAFSYLGPVERTSGKQGGTLRWSGAWTSGQDVDGTLRLKKGACKSERTPFAAMAQLPIFLGLQYTQNGCCAVTLTWPVVSGAAYYYVMRAPASGGPYAYGAYSTDTSEPDDPPAAGSWYWIVRAFDPSGEAVANSNEVGPVTLGD